MSDAASGMTRPTAGPAPGGSLPEHLDPRLRLHGGRDSAILATGVACHGRRLRPVQRNLRPRRRGQVVPGAVAALSAGYWWFVDRGGGGRCRSLSARRTPTSPRPWGCSSMSPPWKERPSRSKRRAAARVTATPADTRRRHRSTGAPSRPGGPGPSAPRGAPRTAQEAS
jgi:hypothetical protein